MTLIDGHNVFFALDRDRSSSFEQDLNTWKNECLLKCQREASPFILVLDGSGGGHPNGREERVGTSGRVVYSGTLSADDWIEAWIFSHQQSMVKLVSADRRLYEKVKFKRVVCLEPLAWWKKLSHCSTPKSKKAIKTLPKKNFGSTDDWLRYFDSDQ